MKLSLSWVKEFLDLDLPPEEIADALTLAGLEAEGMEEVDGDVIFEIGLTPNLGHCMSIAGIARELSAILQIPLKRKEVFVNESKEKTSDQITVQIEDESQCLRYSCRLVKKVQVGPSPQWLKLKLENSGLRSVNNLVDIGNLVMLETGQPLHMFDYDKLHGKTIVVKAATKAEKMVTLDDEKRDIPKGVLLISDEKGPIAFAGVMGELHSSVTEETKNVLIEAAQFSPEAVRKTSKLLNLRTDSSLRFERGIDPLSVEPALELATQYLSSVGNGEICKGAVRQIAREFTPSILNLNTERANRLLGTELSIGEIISLLERLEIKVLSESGTTLKVEPPSYRNDLHAEIDLIEEVGRMFGFNNIPRKIPRHASSTITHAPLFLFEEEIRTKLVAQGLQECLTCDLISPKLAEISLEKALDTSSQIHVLHPASADQSILRTSLMPGLLEVAKFNQDRQTQTIATFEVGHIHFKDGEKFYGEPSAGILLTGSEAPYHFKDKPEKADFFDLKGHVENLLSAIGVEEALFEPSHLQSFHPGRQASVKIGKVTAGVLGEVHPKHLRTMGISQKVYYAELNLHDLLDLKRNQYQAKKIAPFPGSQRDWTITLKEKTPIAEILSEIKSGSSPILEHVFLLDLYQSEKLGKDKKNASFRFVYRDPSRTIEYEAVEKEHTKLTQSIAEKFADSVG